MDFFDALNDTLQLAKNTFVVSIIIMLLLLNSCSVIYGEKILEQEKTFSKDTVFEFNLNESKVQHKINLEVAYQGTTSITQGKFKAVLTDSEGKESTTTLEIINSDRKAVTYADDESTLFKITPKRGKYALRIIEDQFSHIDGKNLKLKVYKE